MKVQCNKIACILFDNISNAFWLYFALFIISVKFEEYFFSADGRKIYIVILSEDGNINLQWNLKNIYSLQMVVNYS